MSVTNPQQLRQESIHVLQEIGQQYLPEEPPQQL